MSKRQKEQQQEEKTTEKARWMLEGSHGMARDADAAVALLEEKVKDGNAEAMWMLGVCCEFGIGTEQDVDRAEQLYKRGAEQENATAELLTKKLKNENGRGCTQMDLEREQAKTNNSCISPFVKQLRFLTDHLSWPPVGETLASMLLMHVPLTTLNLDCKICPG